jgi:anti-sigma B factor antagonist
MTDLARLDIEVHGSTLLVVLTGEIDLSNAAELERQVVAAAGALPGLVVDLTAVTFLDSAGVRLLDHLVASREPDPQVRVVVSATGPVPFTLRLCGFRSDLLCGSRDEALADLSG